MSTTLRYWWVVWLAGLFVFALLRIPHGPLAIPEVPGGILDHQAAGTAAEVDRIQAAWAAAGLSGHAFWGMVGDFVFIGIYGVGAVLGGLHFRSGQRFLGTGIALAGGLFLLTDYTETISQFIQLTRDAGEDRLAAIAATAQPVKIAAFVISFLGILAALVIRRFSRPAA